jgi:hypothetical protein
MCIDLIDFQVLTAINSKDIEKDAECTGYEQDLFA